MTLVCVKYPDPSAGTMPDDLANALIDQMGKTAFAAFFALLPSASVGWIAIQNWPVDSASVRIESMSFNTPTALSLAVRVQAFGCWRVVDGEPQSFVWVSAGCEPNLVEFASDGLLELIVEQVHQAPEQVQQF